MALANCKECGNLFNKVSRDLCDSCFKLEEEVLSKVQKYVKENPQSNIMQVSEATDVEEDTIMKFVRSKRLILKSVGEGEMLTCEFCGAPIVSGRACVPCRQQLSAGIKLVSKAEPQKPSPSSTRREELSGGSSIVKFRRK